MNLNQVEDKAVLKYRSKTDARGRIIYFLSGVAYLIIGLCVFYIIYKLATKDAVDKGVQTASEEAFTQTGGARYHLPLVLYIGVIAVAIGLIWTTLRIRNGNDFLAVY